VISENIFRAFSSCPSPKVLAISALHPVPNINPNVPTTIRKSIIKLTAAKGILPTKLDMKKPSTTP
jgi:hypothetical protein